MKFYIGLHIPAHCGKFKNSFISINLLKDRKSDINPINWILDSAAFTQVEKYGDFLMSAAAYVKQINRWANCGNLEMAVSQDYMCESFILKKWGRTVKDHQQMTVERYYQIINNMPQVYVMPVLQGYTLEEYLHCADMYDFPEGSYVGIGSVCKRNKNVGEIRFTIGTNDDKTAAYWEPGAPSPSDRLMAIAHACTLGFKTSVSMEPLLIEQPKEMIDNLFMGWITGEIWIGAMNHYRLNPGIPEEARQIKIQGRENMQRVYDSLKDNPQIRWKDSVQRLLGIMATGEPVDSMKVGVREP